MKPLFRLSLIAGLLGLLVVGEVTAVPPGVAAWG